jgi:ubiquinone/menaquinone biosynthesis C-methylase UbiE
MTTTAAPDPIAYLDATATLPVGRAYKSRLLDALDLRPGEAVLDLGCGPGTDLPALAAAVGGSGWVIGVDHDPAMAAEAARRTAELSTVEIRQGDAHELPVHGASLDAARTDRVLQHVTDPAAVLREVRRVLRAGGRLGMAEPDWDTLALAGDDIETSRAFARFVAGRVRNATIGRQLLRLAERAGFVEGSVEAVPVVFRDAGTADAVLGLHRNTARAVEAGVLAAATADGWLASVLSGPFLASFTVYLVVVRAV